MTLETLSEANAGAVHTDSVLSPSTIPGCLGKRALQVEAKLDTGKFLPNDCL